MNLIRAAVLTSLALGVFSVVAPVQAQALQNGAKSLKKLPKYDPFGTPTLAPTVTEDPKDRVQWGEKQDPPPPGITLQASVSSTEPPAGTHRSRSQSVPEPTTLGLLALGGLGLLRRRR